MFQFVFFIFSFNSPTSFLEIYFLWIQMYFILSKYDTNIYHIKILQFMDHFIYSYTWLVKLLSVQNSFSFVLHYIFRTKSYLPYRLYLYDKFIIQYIFFKIPIFLKSVYKSKKICALLIFEMKCTVKSP